jgi:hypothetical protein
MEDVTKMILDRLEDVSSKVDSILIQTTKTNGRVSKLEEWKSDVHKVAWVISLAIGTVIGFYIQHAFFH